MTTTQTKLLRSEQDYDNNLPEQIEVFKNLYILFKGDYLKMEWFYENRTYADLMLMICVHNLESRE